ncbi:diaminopimelate decarboxylase [Amycolatopsis sp. H20-H5]|uniref:diaminopimelate decarboxylase n=1 Tax=Amycolatopsis sp. H20-H5 TaxID=3046309 RepID=UPI002DB66658|nr:diaminopimelate decarboxylase [Amycolatopsis sp. H20-H5]MEC3976738.1 diaminopimelate decarboxylase [Amycolatopsis sp. H20-H5]
MTSSLGTTAETSSALASRRERALAAATRQGLLGPDAPIAAFLDLAGITETTTALREAFAPLGTVQHTFAAKACSLVPVLGLLAAQGIDVEVASPGETAIAEAAGLPGERLVLDSPAKTVGELRHALASGTAINVDNVQELDRLDALIGGSPPRSVLGIRVNPQVGTGTIGDTSTATGTSKFGVPLRDPGNRELLIELVSRRPWLTRLHVHVGSQGCPLDLIADGVAAVLGLAEEINHRLRRRQITSIDLGGGLPVNFADDRIDPSYTAYVETLRERVPGLFTGDYTFVTEFGRSLLAKNGFMASKVEYTKIAGGRPIAVTHAGVQVATRTVMQPDLWPLRLGAFSAAGAPKQGPAVGQDIAGPCCFAGDVLAKNRPLPLLEPGDIVAAYDTGAYYFSAHFSYNSLPRPAVHGFTVADDGSVRFTTIRTRQTLGELVRESGGAHATALLPT